MEKHLDTERTPRAGDVAPGFMWCKFDEVLSDELQPLWIAVLLWRDVQIRLTVLRPTLPVMAFEAPGALGCEQPAGIMRRSDDQAGWEYAEAEGRAIAIQRLVGYDCQKASAPFLDQSNINVAYTYSEQPILYESQASVAARCLAALRLSARLHSILHMSSQESKSKLNFRRFSVFTLPDGSLALVAPGETTPKHATVNGVEVEGINMRYVQVSNDLNEISWPGSNSYQGNRYL